MSKKPTLATLKAFIRKNRSNLQIMCKSSFDCMTDCVEQNDNAAFRPIKPYDDIHGVFKINDMEKNTLGIAGVWLVGSSRDYIKEYSKDGMFGYEVYNCCGSFVLALNLAECDAKAKRVAAYTAACGKESS